VLDAWSRRADEGDLRASPVPVDFEGLACRTLRREPQLLHILAHGLRWDSSPSYRWVADACTLLSADEGPFDWRFLYDQAARHGLTLTVARALDYVSEDFGVHVPDARLHGGVRRVGWGERLEYWAKVRPARGPLAKGIRFFRSYRRVRASARALGSDVGLHAFARAFRGEGYPWRLPRAG
jgi:hypothetical protein